MTVPKVLGHEDRYRIEREIARGRASVLYRAYDKTTARWVAIKVLFEPSTQAARGCFQAESASLAGLRHPGVALFLDSGEFWDGNTEFPYVVLPLMKGKTLAELLRQDPDRMTAEEAVRILMAAAGALQAAHEHGAVHGDIRPSNIFVPISGSPLVTDFGIACFDPDFQPGPYALPESSRSHPARGPEADTFAFAVTCYETLAGRYPHEEGARPHGALPPGPRPDFRLNPAVGRVLDRVLKKAVAKAPDVRYRSVAEFAGDLDRVFHDSGALSRAAPASRPEIHQPGRNMTEPIESNLRTVRSHLAGGRFADAIAVCDEVLSGHDAPSIFAALKLEAEARDCDARLDYINKTRAALDGVADLNARVAVAQQAAMRYPGETLLSEMLQAARAKRDFVNGLIAQAKDAEARGRYDESLECWRTVRECHPLQPGVEAHTEEIKASAAEPASRLEKPRAEKLRPEEPARQLEVPRGVTYDIESEEVPETRGKPFRALALIAAVLVAALGLFFGYQSLRPGSGAPAAAPTIDIAASPAGAEIFIDGEPAGTSSVRRELSPGPHEVLVSLAGYRSATQSVEGSGAQSISIELEPIPMELKVVTDRPAVEVWVDGEAVEAKGGEAFIRGISAGEHVVRVKTDAGEIESMFEFRPGAPPVPVLPAAQRPSVVFLSSFSGSLRTECNCKAQLKVNEDTRALSPGDTVEFDVSEGQFSAELEGLGSRRTLEMENGEAPTATVGVFWAAPRPPAQPVQQSIPALVDVTVGQISARKCREAQATINSILAREPGNVDAVGLQRRLDRLKSIDPTCP